MRVSYLRGPCETLELYLGSRPGVLIRRALNVIDYREERESERERKTGENERRQLLMLIDVRMSAVS